MSEEKWTGRKYRAYTGTIFEVLTEPFDWKGRKYVAYGAGSHSDTCYTTAFEGDGYTRIIEAPFQKGDKIERDGVTATVDAVSSATDEDGDFIAIIIGSDGDADITYLTKGYPWTKVDA